MVAPKILRDARKSEPCAGQSANTTRLDARAYIVLKTHQCENPGAEVTAGFH